jgi:hypothetical protein
MISVNRFGPQSPTRAQQQPAPQFGIKVTDSNNYSLTGALGPADFEGTFTEIVDSIKKAVAANTGTSTEAPEDKPTEEE